MDIVRRIRFNSLAHQRDGLKVDLVGLEAEDVGSSVTVSGSLMPPTASRGRPAWLFRSGFSDQRIAGWPGLIS
ncbi:hypothetical protein [Streptomyces sp. NPDC005009]